MKKGIIFTLLIVLVIVGVLIAWGVGSVYSARNYAVETENVLEAEYKDMENILAQYSLKVTEVAQVPGMMKDDLAEVSREAMSGRYGENGSQAVFQWIQENYPGQIDPQLYRQIQQVMEAGRNKFENAQTKLIDTLRAYKSTLEKNLPLQRGWWVSIAGYPKDDLDDYRIISSEYAQESFETGVGQAIELRPGEAQ